MRFLSLIVTVAAILASCYLGFNMMSVKKEIEELTVSIEDEERKAESYKKDIAESQAKIEECFAEISELNDTLTHTELMDHYKKFPTAFLTFDDGPNVYTPQILDLLDKNDIKATFFIIASQLDTDTNKNTLKRIADSGHAVAIHCYDHTYSKIYSSVDAYFEDLYKAQDAIEEICGVKSYLVRLPGGTASAKDFCKQYGDSDDIYAAIMKRLKTEGFLVIDWTADTEDWSSKATTSSIVEAVSTIAKRRASNSYTYKALVVLMHSKKITVSSLQSVIDTINQYKYNDIEYTYETLQVLGYTTIQAPVD